MLTYWNSTAYEAQFSRQSNNLLGLTDSANEGKWVWSSDGSGLDYSNWGNGNPSGGAEDCAEYFYWNESMPWGWNDDLCTSSRWAICQKELINIIRQY